MVGLTGTPSSNGLMDLWSEIGILDGGQRLGKFIGRYREAYFKAGSMNPQTGVVFQYVPRPGAEEQIYERISDITISMKALDYLDMPECISTIHEVEMDKREKTLYDMLAKDLLIPLENGDIDAANAAALSGKLLQMANGAVYDENGEARRIHDRKLEKLEDLIEAANGQSVLIAYWYKHDRERIISHLDKMGTGKGYQNLRGYHGLECRDHPSGADPSGICRTWAEYPARRSYPGLVWTDLEPGTLPADECTVVEAGTDRGGKHPPHRHKRHSG